eukprot:6945825-Pyramimonas_sp.AAC.1
MMVISYHRYWLELRIREKWHIGLEQDSPSTSRRPFLALSSISAIEGMEAFGSRALADGLDLGAADTSSSTTSEHERHTYITEDTM